jgi:REP element-mobilizing transposase RayT
LNSGLYQRTHEGLQLHGYVVLENHLHFIAQAPRLDQCVSRFKSYTAARLLELLKAHRAERILERLHFAKKAHKKGS